MEALSCLLRDAFPLWEKDTIATDSMDFRIRRTISRLQFSSLLYTPSTHVIFHFKIYNLMNFKVNLAGLWMDWGFIYDPAACVPSFLGKGGMWILLWEILYISLWENTGVCFLSPSLIRRTILCSDFMPFEYLHLLVSHILLVNGSS